MPSSDVLPWQCITRYPKHCENVIFVDVDFPDLMKRKREIVLNTPELRAPLTDLEDDLGDSPILLRSKQYCQVGCDLSNIETLQTALSSLVGIAASSFLFVAEVSITYMETEAANSLIEWSSTLGDCK